MFVIPQLIIGCAVAVNDPAARPGQQNGPDAAAGIGKEGIGVYARIVDVGSAMCVIAATRDRHYFVYDAGGSGGACLKAIREIVSDGKIDLLVISHSDGAHMLDVPALLDELRVGEIWWTGYRRPQLSYRKTARAIAAVAAAGTRVRNPGDDALAPGARFSLGDAAVTFIAGWQAWPALDGLSEAEQHKVVSIVVKLAYGDSSLLLTGDTIGRSASGPDDECGFAEADMLTRQGEVPLRADVLLAPNHGADNASSRCLIDAVQPDYVIFPAGHDGALPAATVAARYLAAGIPDARLFRTDRGDDEGADEWDYLRAAGCRDQPGDDDVEVLMPDQGPPIVGYLQPDDFCVVFK